MIIEKGIPLPERRPGRRQNELRMLLDQMEVGDSVLAPDLSSGNVRCQATLAGQRIGGKFTAEKTSKGIRVWRAE